MTDDQARRDSPSDPALVLAAATDGPQIRGSSDRRAGHWRRFIWPDIASERDARTALTVGTVANAISSGFAVLMGFLVGVISAKLGASSEATAAFVAPLLIGAALAWATYWLKARQSIVAGWIGFSVYAAFTAFFLVLLVPNLLFPYDNDRSIGLVLSAEFPFIALLAVCSYQGLRGTWWLRRNGAAAVIEKTGFWANLDLVYLYLRFDGRINRKPYILAALLLGLVANALFPLMVLAAVGLITPRDSALLQLAYQLVMLYPVVALAVKRLHDRNLPGYPIVIAGSFTLFYHAAGLAGLTHPGAPGPFDYLFIMFAVPITLWLIIQLVFLRGTAGPNRYGPDPLNVRTPT